MKIEDPKSAQEYNEFFFKIPGIILLSIFHVIDSLFTLFVLIKQLKVVLFNFIKFFFLNFSIR